MMDLILNSLFITYNLAVTLWLIAMAWGDLS